MHMRLYDFRTWIRRAHQFAPQLTTDQLVSLGIIPTIAADNYLICDGNGCKCHSDGCCGVYSEKPPYQPPHSVARERETKLHERTSLDGIRTPRPRVEHFPITRKSPSAHSRRRSIV